MYFLSQLPWQRSLPVGETFPCDSQVIAKVLSNISTHCQFAVEYCKAKGCFLNQSASDGWFGKGCASGAGIRQLWIKRALRWSTDRGSVRCFLTVWAMQVLGIEKTRQRVAQWGAECLHPVLACCTEFTCTTWAELWLDARGEWVS